MYTTKNNSERILLVISSCLAILFGILAASGKTPLILLLFAPIIPLFFIMRDFRVGALLLVPLLPFQHTPFLPSFTGFNIITYLTVASVLALWGSRFFNNKSIAPLPNIFWWAYILPILVAGIHGAFYISEAPAIFFIDMGSLKTYFVGLVIKPLSIVLIAWLIGSAYTQTEKKERLIIPLIIASVIPALITLNFILSQRMGVNLLVKQRQFLDPLGMHANEFGTLLSIGFTLILFLIPATSKGYAKIALLGCFSLVSVALLLTFSRGGYSAAITAIIGFIIIHRQIKYGFIIIGILALVIAINPDLFIHRFTAGFDDSGISAAANNDHDALTAGRVWLWKRLLPEFLSSPIWGNGVGSTSWSSAAKLGLMNVTHPHSLFLHVLLDLGCIGLFLFSIFVHYLLKKLKSVAANLNTPPLFIALAHGTRFAILGFLVSGFATGYYVPKSESSILWMAIGLLLPLIAQQENQQKNLMT